MSNIKKISFYYDDQEKFAAGVEAEKFIKHLKHLEDFANSQNYNPFVYDKIDYTIILNESGDTDFIIDIPKGSPLLGTPIKITQEEADKLLNEQGVNAQALVEDAVVSLHDATQEAMRQFDKDPYSIENAEESKQIPATGSQSATESVVNSKPSKKK